MPSLEHDCTHLAFNCGSSASTWTGWLHCQCTSTSREPFRGYARHVRKFSGAVVWAAALFWAALVSRAIFSGNLNRTFRSQSSNSVCVRASTRALMVKNKMLEKRERFTAPENLHPRTAHTSDDCFRLLHTLRLEKHVRVQIRRCTASPLSHSVPFVDHIALLLRVTTELSRRPILMLSV